MYGPPPSYYSIVQISEFGASGGGTSNQGTAAELSEITIADDNDDDDDGDNNFDDADDNDDEDGVEKEIVVDNEETIIEPSTIQQQQAQISHHEGIGIVSSLISSNVSTAINISAV